ncbi:MAG: hypothetical protein ACO1QR_15205 [Chthoniobacteraceae bacterium]
MDFRKLGLLGACVLLGIVLWCAWLWQPERQVRLHQQNFLQALEDRDWERIAKFVDDNYSDRWGHDKGFVLREGREAFRSFVVLDVEGETADLFVDSGRATVLSRLRMRGRGNPIAETVMSRVNGLQEPWRFEWEQGNRPWKWHLTRLDHTQLHIPDSPY